MRCTCGARSASRQTPANDSVSRSKNLYHLPFDRFERYCPSGSARDIADFLARYVDAGCASFNLLTVGHDSEQVAGAAEVRQLLNR